LPAADLVEEQGSWKLPATTPGTVISSSKDSHLNG